jgi:hypothetical protein
MQIILIDFSHARRSMPVIDWFLSYLSTPFCQVGHVEYKAIVICEWRTAKYEYMEGTDHYQMTEVPQ